MKGGEGGKKRIDRGIKRKKILIKEEVG